MQTTTASVVPALTRDLLAIPFGTAQQLLPVQAQRLQDSPQLGRGGEATLVVLVDCNQRSWPMRCTFDRWAAVHAWGHEPDAKVLLVLAQLLLPRYGATLMDNVWHCFARCTFDRCVLGCGDYGAECCSNASSAPCTASNGHIVMLCIGRQGPGLATCMLNV